MSSERFPWRSSPRITRAETTRLNAAARELLAEAGRLGPDALQVDEREFRVGDLEGYLHQLANPPEPAPLVGAGPARRTLRNAGLSDSNGRPGASAMVQYRQWRAADRHSWRATFPQRLVGRPRCRHRRRPGHGDLVGPSLAWLTGPVAAIVVAWLLRFRPSSATLAWRHGADGERRTARLLAPLERHGFQVFHDLAVPGSAANAGGVGHLVVGPTGCM